MLRISPFLKNSVTISSKVYFRISQIKSLSTTRTDVWSNSQLVGEYAELPITPVTLDYLLNLKQDIVDCALFSHNELPKRLARRVRAIEGLPFIVGTNPYISKVYDLYKDSFNTLVRTPPPKSPESIQNFTKILSGLTDSHQQVIPLLASGFMESGKYMTLETRQKFLDQMISARIGIRLIAEHYLSLHHPNSTGIVSRNSYPAKILRNICEYVQQICELNYGTFPDFVINGYVDTSVAYINVHFEYIFMELIKNAMRATVEKSLKLSRLEHPIIEITIGKSENFVVIRLLELTRFRDEGGGVQLKDEDRIWEYSFTTVKNDENVEENFLSNQARMSMVHSTGGPIAGLGFGLPMSRVYAKYFGGSLGIRSVCGIGADVFVEFPNISMVKRNHQIL